jgi:hypothetical protein
LLVYGRTRRGRAARTGSGRCADEGESEAKDGATRTHRDEPVERAQRFSPANDVQFFQWIR